MKQNPTCLNDVTEGGLRFAWILNTFTLSDAWEPAYFLI